LTPLKARTRHGRRLAGIAVTEAAMSITIRSYALVLLATAALAGCDRKAPLSATPGENHALAAAVSAEPTSLWRIEVISDGKATSQLDICADNAVQSAFTRPAPEVNGRPCVKVGEAVEKDGTYSVRCRIDDALYRVGSTTEGDLTKDFKVDMAVARQDRKGPDFEQVRHYTRLGGCPAGWRIGDSAAPGAKQVVNTLGAAEAR
jgi:hypothetical protein